MQRKSCNYITSSNSSTSSNSNTSSNSITSSTSSTEYVHNIRSFKTSNYYYEYVCGTNAYIYRDRKHFKNRNKKYRKCVLNKECKSPFLYNGKPVRPEFLNSSDSENTYQGKMVKLLIKRYELLSSDGKERIKTRINELLENKK